MRKILKGLCAAMATAANKNKIRTFEAEIGPQNKNIEVGQNFTGS